jgi:hypothetical protein
MLVPVETDYRRGTFYMRQIGEIAAKLISDPKRLVAAANERCGTELGTGQPGEEIPTSPSKASTEQGVTGGDAVMKRTGAETPASDARGVHQTIEPFGAASIASLTVVRSIVMVAPAAAPRKRQAPKVSAMIIDLATYRAVHHRPAQLSKSGTA